MENKIIITTLLIIVMLLSGCTSHSNDKNTPKYEEITLTQEEVEILAAMEADIITVADSEFEANVTAITEHTHDYVGTVYQLEGVFSVKDVHGESMPYLVQNTSNDGGETELGLPLKYLEKKVVEGAPIRVTAIIGEENHDGHTHAVLEVVALESVK